ncbi:MAG: hypothetical protein JXP73_14340 [Deltaproteobacteria bacterium]|nr:hypothetical protein [Deltaproteobacteria bacterium]
MKMPWSLCGLVAVALSCDFDAAFERYCENNPACQKDAAAGPEAGPDSGPETDPNRDAGEGERSRSIALPKVCGRNNEGCDSRNEVCHPFGQVCMRKCETADDCPPWLDTCAEIREPGGQARTGRVCMCSSTKVCNSYDADFVCHNADNLCEPLCENDDDCSRYQPTRFCDRLTSQCVRDVRICLGNWDCPSAAQPHCDPVSQRCTGCVDDSDCSERPDGLVQCGPTGSCVAP